MRGKTFCILLAACCLHLINAWSTPLLAKSNAPYALKTITMGKNKGYDVVRLYNTKTQRTIWTRRLRHDSSRVTGWSKDGRALAIYLRWDTILVWRLGYRTRFFKAPKEEDYIMSFNWSPDNRRLLIHSGSSGTDMTPLSHLFCLNIASKRMYSVHKGAGKVSWVGAREVRYSVLKWDDKAREWVKNGKPHIWHSP